MKREEQMWKSTIYTHPVLGLPNSAEQILKKKKDKFIVC